MSFQFSTLPRLPVIAILVAAACGWANGAESRRGRAIEFSEPKSADVITNLNQLTTKKNGLTRLEEDLYRPLQSFAPKSSMEGIFDPPERRRTAPVVPSKRAKELLERQRNWVFLDPDDLATGPTAEEIFNIREYDESGQEKKPSTVLEKYFEKQERKRDGKDKTDKHTPAALFSAGKDADSLDDEDSRESRKRSGDEKESNDGIGKLFGDDSNKKSPPLITRGSLSDIFGMGTPNRSAEDTAKHTATMRSEYGAILSSGWKPPSESGSTLGGFSDTTKHSFSSFGGSEAFSSVNQRANSSSLAGTMPSFNSSPARSGLSDFGVKTPAAPVVAPPAPAKLTPPTPTFAAPRRSF